MVTSFSLQCASVHNNYFRTGAVLMLLVSLDVVLALIALQSGTVNVSLQSCVRCGH